MSGIKTLGQFIIEKQADFSYAKGELSRLLRDMGIAAKIVNREVNKALASADIQEYFGSRGFTLGGSSATEFKAFVKVEADKWAKIVQASGAKPD